MQCSIALLAPLAIIILTVSAALASPENDTIDLQVLAFNDLHGQLEPPIGKLTVHYNETAEPTKIDVGGVEYLAARIKALKAENPNTIVVSAGDNIGASPLTSALFRDEPTIQALNLMEVDYSAVGNHDLDEGITELGRIQSGLCHPLDGCFGGKPYAGAGFSYLAANMANNTTGEAIFPPYKIHFIQGVPIGIIGIALKDTPTITSSESMEGLKFFDEAGSINRYSLELEKKGVQTIIVLIHDGGTQYGSFNESVNLMGSIVDIINHTDDEVDAFITGHTHRAYNSLVDGRIVTQAGSNGRILTDVDLIISKETRDVIYAHARNIPVSHDMPKDPAMSELVDEYRSMAAPRADVVVGSITTNITTAYRASGESALGDVIADAQQYATANSSGAVVAFMNSGGIRANLVYPQISGSEMPGQVTYEEAYSVQPFGNGLVTMTLTGAQIKDLLEEQFDNPLPGKKRVLQVSRGFSYTWNKSAPLGCKVEMGSIRLNGTAINPSAIYRVTVNSFLADGGDNFTVLKEGTDRMCGPNDLTALIEYLKANSPVSRSNTKRIWVAS